MEYCYLPHLLWDASSLRGFSLPPPPPCPSPQFWEGKLKLFDNVSEWNYSPSWFWGSRKIIFFNWSALLFPLSSSIYSFIHFCTARPESPTIISVETTDREALVTWTFNDDGGLELKALILQYRKSSQKDWDEIQIKPPNKNKYTIMYLDPDTNYNFRILATNSLGTSTPSSTYFANTKKKGKKTPSSKKSVRFQIFVSFEIAVTNLVSEAFTYCIHSSIAFIYRFHMTSRRPF